MIAEELIRIFSINYSDKIIIDFIKEFLIESSM